MVAALGTGIVIGAGVAYIYTRFHEHTRLVQQITNLHVSILEVLKKDLASAQTCKMFECTDVFLVIWIYTVLFCPYRVSCQTKNNVETNLFYSFEI